MDMPIRVFRDFLTYIGMATEHPFICPDCDYTCRGVKELQGIAKPMTKIGSVTCRDCQEVRDTYIEIVISIDNSSEQPKCDYCKGDNTLLWTNNDWPCPKCDTRMQVDPNGEVIMVD